MPSIPRGSEQRAGEEAPTTEAPAVPAPDGATVEPQATTPDDAAPRFRQRARMRRRLRYLRRLRELAFRDLGGLVFDLHRFGRDRDDLVQGKLEALREIDAELRMLETALDDRREYTDLREAGVAACPRCGALHDTGASFCPGCGTSLRRSVVSDAAPVSVTPAEGDAAQPEQQPSSTPS
jgi:zinc-ribbon domain